MMGDILITLLGVVVTTLLAFTVGMFFMGANRKITARVHNRIGPPIYQNFLDVIKLQSKGTSINHGWMQHLGPAFLMVSSVGSLLIIPVLNKGFFFENFSFQGDLILLVYLMVFGSLGMALGAGQTGNPNSAIGVTRGLTQMVGFEIPWVMAIVAIIIQYDTSNIMKIMEIQSETGVWTMFSNPYAFIAAILAALGMFRYSPFDIVGAPAELASGPVSENGGKYLGTMMSSSAVFAFVKLVLYVNLFMGGADNLVVLLIKTFGLYLIPILYGMVNPRYRTEQSVRYFYTWPLIFGVIAILFAVFN